MPGLISTEPIIARSFYLDFPNLSGFVLSGVSGLEVELDVVPLAQNGKDGKQQHIKSLGGGLKVPEISVTRMAPQNAGDDPLWKWFLDIRDHGMKNRTDKRQDGSIIMYDAAGTEVGRYNVFGCWPSKIAADALSTESNEALKESVTFQAERIERAKCKLSLVTGMRTSYEFTLPRGYVDGEGAVHKRGRMRLATARDELEPLRNPTITGPDDPRLTVMVLGRVVEELGTLSMVTEREIEGLFAVDLAFLQDFYGVINFGSQDEYEALLQAQSASSLVGEPRPVPAPSSESPPDGSPDTEAGETSATGRASLRAAVEELPRQAL